MSIEKFEDIDAWKKSREIVNSIYKISNPKSQPLQSLAKPAKCAKKKIIHHRVHKEHKKYLKGFKVFRCQSFKYLLRT